MRIQLKFLTSEKKSIRVSVTYRFLLGFGVLLVALRDSIQVSAIESSNERFITAEDLQLLEDFELRLLKDFIIKGKGRGSISKADVKFESDPLADVSVQTQPQISGHDPDMLFAPIIPQMIMPNMKPSQSIQNPSIKKSSNEKIYVIDPQKIQQKRPTAAAKNNLLTLNNKAEKPSLNSEVVKDKDLSSEDYEKLAKILQQFVNRRKPMNKEIPDEETNTEAQKTPIKIVAPKNFRKTTKKPLEIIYLPPTAPTTSGNSPLDQPVETPKHVETLEEQENSEETMKPLVWNGSVEKLPQTTTEKIVTEDFPAQKLTTSNTNRNEPMSENLEFAADPTLRPQILGRVSFQPSQQHQTQQGLTNFTTNDTDPEFISITGDKQKTHQEKQDLELKIRKIGTELSNVLNKLKAEKDGIDQESLAQMEQSMDAPPMMAQQSTQPVRHYSRKPADSQRQQKAYVTILREGLARQSASNQYSFVASITLIRDEGKIILVDTGLGTDINGRTDLIKQLTKLNIAPPRINYVITTHGHPDHAGNTNEFPDAIHFQGTVSYYRNKFNFSDLFENDSLQLTTNVLLMKTPGHTSEDISVFVQNTDKYGIIAVAGDVFIASEDLDYPMMWRPLAWNEKVQEDSRKTLICMADYIVPGHGKVFHVTSQLKARFPCKNEKKWLKVQI